jgi:diguanylate cyclase (GGDEF)-like protein
VLRKRTTRLVSELDPDRDRELASILPDARNVAIVPMKSETTVGVLLAECGPRNAKMARRSVEMLIRFASHGALALRNAQLLEEMKTLASTDALTGVANRRTFDAVLAWEIRRAKRSRKPVSLILADVDHFKTLNDAQGHGVGDRALQELASLLTNNVRSVDSVARIGGEEFAIVMPECGVKEAAARAELVRKTLADGKGPHKLTVSLGVAAYPDNAVDGSNLLIAADKALYASKCAGRNKVSISAEGSSRPSGKRQRNVRPKNVRVAEGSRR